MHAIWRSLLVLVFFSCCTNGRAGPDTADAESLRPWIMSMHEWVMPRYRQFEQDSRLLSKALDRACEQPSSAAAIANARDLWIRSMRDWRVLEVLQLGPTLQRRSSKTVDFWPTRPSVIEMAVAATVGEPVSGVAAEEAMQRWGTAAKGLPAIEWFLFADNADVPPLHRTQGHCLYTRRIARGVAQEAAVLSKAWAHETRQLKAAPESDIRKMTRDALNLMVGSCELLRGKKLQKGARLVSLGGRESGITEAFDSVRSGRSHEFLLVHFEALSQIVLGRSSAVSFAHQGPSIGLRDLLLRLGLEAEAAALVEPAVRAHAAMVALPANPRQWTVESTEAVADALRDLRAVLDPVISAPLGITVTFSDADGD